MKRSLHLIGLLAAAVPVWAGEYVVLDNGFRLHADRHELAGGALRIYSGSGATEIPADRVAGYELEEIVPAAPASEAAKLEPASEPPAAAVEPETALELAHEAAAKLALPASFESLMRSVMKAESALNPAAVSPKGAIGLMQLMPETAKQLRIDPKVPRENADGGARYLRDLLARYEGKPNQVLLALAAYNAGPEAVDKYHGVPPYRETREYILRVLKNWNPEGDGARASAPDR